DGLAGGLDVAPTLLAAAGLAPASEGLAGIAAGTRQRASVVAYTTGQQARSDNPFTRSVLSRLTSRAERDAKGQQVLSGEKKKQLAAMRLAGAKLLAGAEGEPRYYDLMSDPEEASPQPVPPGLEAERDRLLDILSRPIDRPSD